MLARKLMMAQGGEVVSPYAQLILASNPYLYAPLDESDSTGLALNLGTGPDGIFVNSPTMFQAPVCLDGGKSMTMHTAADRATSKYAEFAKPMFGANLTVECWIKATALGGALVASYLAGNNNFLLSVDSYGRISFYIFKAGIAASVSSNAGAVVINNTYHIVAVYNGTTVRILRNGVQVATANTTGSIDNDEVPITIMARGANAQDMTGLIDNVAVYPTALSDATIISHYDMGK